MTQYCSRCHRPIKVVIVVDGHGFGKRCAQLQGDLLVQPQPRAPGAKPRQRRRDEGRLFA